MHAKNNRQNSDFQIAYFLAGSCHTADGAYALLCDLREDRVNALNQVKAAQLRKRAKQAKARAVLAKPDALEHEKLEAEADLAEIEGWEATERANILAAEAELATIEKCIARVQPLRKFGTLSDAEAHQAAQQEEWKLELIYRAENFLLTVGHIPTDHFSTMRQHPEFATAILPAVNKIDGLIANGQRDELLKLTMVERTFDLPKLLEA